jgi:hypothetical protein
MSGNFTTSSRPCNYSGTVIAVQVLETEEIALLLVMYQDIQLVQPGSGAQNNMRLFREDFNGIF